MYVCMATAGLEVREAGRALRVQTEAPHLVSMGSGRLSTAVTLHPLPEGKLTLGSNRDADISVVGTGVESIHCAIENNNGVVTLHPINGSTAVDGVPINSPVRLAQGCMLSIGRSNYMRFNHPAEAKQLRSVLPHSRISMAPISFSLPDNQLQENYHLERKPPVAPRKSPRNSCSDDEIGFLGKLTKFEMLAKQNRNNCVSPKVFPAGAITTNVPADQILGHSRSSSLISLKNGNNSSLLQNLTNLERSRSNTPSFNSSSPAHFLNSSSPATCFASSSPNYCSDESRQRSDMRTPSRSNTPNLQYQNTSTPNHNQIQMYSTAESYLKTYKPYYRDTNNENSQGPHNLMMSKNNVNQGDLMSRSFNCQRANDLDELTPRDFDMSQSLIVTKTTTTEYLQLEKFGSNPNICNSPNNGNFCGGSLRNVSGTPGFGSNPNIKRIQPPSPAFNRNPKYNEPKRGFGRVKSPTPSTGSGCSLEELRERQIDAENKRREAENKRKQAQEERLREQEVERQEKMRLEEILAMCAEYERQSTVEKPRQPNRIKTNGSLPRDKRLGYNSPFDSPKSPSKNQPHFSFDTAKQSNSASYENVCVQNSKVVFQNGNSPNNRRNQTTNHPENQTVNMQDHSQSITPNNNNNSQPTMWPNVLGNGEHSFSGSISQARSSGYENTMIEGSMYNNNSGSYTQLIDPTKDTYGTIQLNGTRINGQQNKHSRNYDSSMNGNVSLYENVVINSVQNNNQNNHSMPKKNGQLSNSCDMIENKLAISNDDLLEAIEQLSMLSKSKEICTIPKKNNSEKDNAKSNEAKADKERKELEQEDRKKYIEFLQNEKLHILSNMDALKRSVADIEIQEEEISRELELEKALLSAEYESESLKLSQDEGEKIKVQMRINELERQMAEDNISQANLQAEAKQRVQRAQHACSRLEEELAICTDEAMQQDIGEKLMAQQDVLESERKAFEDLEFHHLEEEASKLATREELQRYLSELTTKIETRKARLSHLESQRSEAKSTATKDARSLERQKLTHLKRLEEGRNRVRAINDELTKLAQNSCENSDEKRSPSREDFDRISRVTTDSPIVNNQGSLGRKTIESLKEIERNRQLHLAKQGSQVISEERRRVEELKRRVQDEVRSQWEERKMNCTSFNSVESGEESSSYSTGPTESGSGSSDSAEGGTSEKLSPSKLSELTSPSPGPSNNSYSLLQNDNMRDDRRTSMEGERLSNNSGGIIDGNGSRPLSQTSSEMDTLGPLQPVKHREKAKLQRPLTRYLPIKSESLDLRHHIETAGHQLPLIHDVTVDTTSCSGYLSKMSKKFHHWNKRWFVFDRKRKTLSYYSDSSSRKARGVIYFQSIEEVYVDHMNTVRSPQPSLTFIIKTSSRLYHLMAPSPEAMRVWVDVVFTGAEGYHEFDHGI
ncbi:PREDICTED: pleckstrin homology-like domain family B member 2 [Eufriesea mexicana]|uniref:pleckstrin homology-like domain family B member 2 n=1 Tax=Eufriesea mexicana TaxID=516756 RepID=UPI00083C69EF|nr:PREDICTED: pleckstrin homology-like domain family B member 2 [Eufriesea mexicana]